MGFDMNIPPGMTVGIDQRTGAKTLVAEQRYTLGSTGVNADIKSANVRQEKTQADSLDQGQLASQVAGSLANAKQYMNLARQLDTQA